MKYLKAAIVCVMFLACIVALGIIIPLYIVTETTINKLKK